MVLCVDSLCEYLYGGEKMVGNVGEVLEIEVVAHHAYYYITNPAIFWPPLQPNPQANYQKWSEWSDGLMVTRGTIWANYQPP